MLKKTHTTPNSRLSSDRNKRPVVHILRHDAATDALRASVIAVPEDPQDDCEHKIYCLLVNGHGKVVVDSITRKPVLLEAPPLVLGIIDEPDRLLDRNEVSRRTGLSVPTIKRAERAGHLKKVRISERRVGYPTHVIDEWIAKRNAKRAV